MSLETTNLIHTHQRLLAEDMAEFQDTLDIFQWKISRMDNVVKGLRSTLKDTEVTAEKTEIRKKILGNLREINAVENHKTDYMLKMLKSMDTHKKELARLRKEVSHA